MAQHYDKKYRPIAINELQFARRVVYQLRAQNPPPAWHNLIPFKFLFEYLRIRRAIRAFSENALAGRKIALDSAKDMLEGESRAVVHENMQKNIWEWLESMGLSTPSIYEQELALAQTYEEHFSNLLTADGTDYGALVRAVYRVPPKYRQFLDRISETEKKIDRMVCDMAPDNGEDRQTCEKRMNAKQRALAKAREIEMAAVFA